MEAAVLEALKVVADGGSRALRAGLKQAEKAASSALPPEIARHVERVCRVLAAVDLQTLEGLRYVTQGTLAMYREAIARRRRGEYEVDDFGLDPDFLDLIRPLFAFMYKTWWRVEFRGAENIPDGRALLVANHSGVLPWDGAMIAYGIWEQHPQQRIVRPIFLDWFTAIPFAAPLLARIGGALACPENTAGLLERDEAVLVFPEGIKGIGKHFKDRYQLARFGRGGFVREAIRARAPIVPVSVIGAEEIHPNLARIDWLTKPLGIPYMVVTPTFPWLGLLGLVPLPTKWYIVAGRPVRTDQVDPKEADNFLTVSRIAGQVRGEIQSTLTRVSRKRRSVFSG